MYKLLRMAVFALPLAGGAAWAQASGTSGSAGAPGSAMTPPVTDDTRTPLQQRAGRLDDTAPAMPGDATTPVDIPNHVEERATGTDMTTPGSGATDETVHRRKHVDESKAKMNAPNTYQSDTTKADDRNSVKDNLNSDK